MKAFSNRALFFLDLNRFCYEVSRAITRKYKLTVNERNALIVLSDIQPDSISVLSEYLKISRSNTSKVLSTLERKGLIIRLFNKRDKRITHLLLTDEGKNVAGMVFKEINEIFSGRIDRLPDEISAKVLKLIDDYYELTEQNTTHINN
ncbi:MAG: hypothetical protein Kow0098_23740 [Ignavibacteriaceae bacterium]